jgi:hypothetical protein
MLNAKDISRNYLRLEINPAAFIPERARLRLFLKRA